MGNRRNHKRKYDVNWDDDLHNEKSKLNHQNKKHEDANIEGTHNDNVNRDLLPNINKINVADQIQWQEIEEGTCIYYKWCLEFNTLLSITDCNFEIFYNK